jgi:hypothetical protein
VTALAYYEGENDSQPSGNGHQNPIYVGALDGGGNVSRGREAAKQPALTTTCVRRFAMTHRDPDNGSVTNPNDPYHREWGSGSVTATIVAIAIMVGIIAYGATTATKTPPNSAALHHRTTGQAHTGT